MSTSKQLTYGDFEILESIRGFASLYVVIAHCRGVLWIGGKMFLQENPMDQWGLLEYLMFGSSMLTRLAVEFVIVFFVLSGFSIAHSLSKSVKVRGFYVRRMIRIYPPYIAALIWAGLVFLITSRLHPEFYEGVFTSPTFARYAQMSDFFTPSTIIKNLVYLPMDGFITPFWSLTYEVIFYLLAPFLFINRRLYTYLSLLLFMMYHGLELSGFYQLEKNILILFLGVYNFYFFIGYRLYYAFSTITKSRIFSNRKLFQSLILGLLVVTYGVNISLQKETIWSYLPAGLMGCMLIVYAINYQVRIPFLISVGKYSYTLYITHFASIFLFHSIYFTVFSEKDPAFIYEYYVFFFAIPFCLLIARLLFLLVESRTRKILELLRNRS